MYTRSCLRTNNDSGRVGSARLLGVIAILSLCILLLLYVVYILSTSKKNTGNYSESTQGTSANNVSVEESTTRDANLYSINDDFYINYIDDDVFSRIKGKSYNDLSPVTIEELRYVHILHIGTDGQAHTGELIVHMTIAEEILDIFYELYNYGYLIESVRLVDDFGADDNASMSVNNTSCFNARNMSGSDALSWHAYGLAIDINPLYNPYFLDGDVCLPASARSYVDRTQDFNMKIDKNDICYRVFDKHGFTWGGSWENPKDYMHFEKVPEEFLK